MDGDVREGFLCPICMQDLGSFHKLQQHFEQSHTAEDKAVLDQIKGLFTRAKGRFLGRDDELQRGRSTSYTNEYSLQTGNSTPIWEPQEFGVTRSHLESFKKIRDARIDRFVIESNKVLIRLDKLFSQIRLTGKENTKEYEKTLVPWVKDVDVPFCPTCGDRFNVRRRRHHCRLCGAIMCTRCSVFIAFDLAETLVESLKETTSRRRRAVSISAVPGNKPSPKQEIQLRCCCECFKILLKRKSKLEEQANQPLLTLLYEKLQGAIDSASKQAPEYQRMASSLSHGEEDYDLNQANEMRFKMMKYYETIDVVSKKIAALDSNDEENPPRRSALRLQLSVRQTAHAYLQENMLTLPPLPSLPKLELLQKERRKEREKKRREQMLLAERERAEAKRIQEIERLKQERSAAEREPEQRSEMKSPTRRSGLVLKEGWSSAAPRSSGSKRNSLEKDGYDPIMEQINYVKEMISQAQRANRKEEIQSLTSNLAELKSEYNRQRVQAFSSPNVTTSNNKPTKNKNPFLQDEKAGNPFLSKEDNSSNPFEQKAVRSANSNPFLDESTSSNDSNPLLQQICYVSKCLDEAAKLGKKDEVEILRQNLVELQKMYKG